MPRFDGTGPRSFGSGKGCRQWRYCRRRLSNLGSNTVQADSGCIQQSEIEALEQYKSELLHEIKILESKIEK